jgi:predicted hydrocarbon binding protein
MRGFWKKQVENLGGDPSVLLKSRRQIAKEMIIALVAAHGAANTMHNAGYLIGRAACVVKSPCVEFYQGFKDGLNN